MNKLVIFFVLVCVSVAHCASISQEVSTYKHELQKKEARILEVPIGALVLKGVKIAWFLAKSAWSLIGLKVTAIALVANVAIWLLKHSISVIIGAVAAFGFCKLTGKCSLSLVPEEVISIGDTLYYAARSLQNGIELYDGVN